MIERKKILKTGFVCGGFVLPCIFALLGIFVFNACNQGTSNPTQSPVLPDDPADQSNSMVYRSTTGTVKLVLIGKSTDTLLPDDSANSTAFNLYYPDSGDEFAYTLLLYGAEISAGKVTIDSAMRWNFKSADGFEFTAKIRGEGLVFSGAINGEVEAFQLPPIVVNGSAPSTDNGNSGNSGDSGNTDNGNNPDSGNDADDSYTEPEEELPKIIGIEIASPPELNYYAKGQTFEGFGGLAVNKVYDDGTKVAMNAGEYTLTPNTVDTSVSAAKFIKVTAVTPDGTFNAEFLIYIDPDTRVVTDVTFEPPSKKIYYLGESFDKTGMVITAKYHDGTEEKINNNSCAVMGFDNMMRGTQTVTLKVNKTTVPFPVTVKVPADATITLNPYKTGNANHQADFFRTVHIKGKAFDEHVFSKSNLQASVKFGDKTIKFTPNKGIYFGDISGYNADKGGVQTLTLNLDGVTETFSVIVVDVQPDVWFDYGYMRHAGDTAGIGAGTGVYYAAPGETLVLAPVRYLIGYDADNKDVGATYSWTASGGVITPSASGETAAFTPSAAGTTYTVTVSVTGRNFVTGADITDSATTEVVCYAGTVAASKTFTPPLKNFAPGQFTASGNGYGWSLGAAGGYEVWKVNSQNSYKITGNPLATWSEAGIVWVQEDRNGNNIPDEMWYELKGSDDDSAYYKGIITRRYAVTYISSADAPIVNEYGQSVAWTYWADCKGRAGMMYAGFPGTAWGVTGDRVTYTGTLLRDDGNIDTGEYGGLSSMGGYVDAAAVSGTKWSGDDWDRYHVSDAIRADGSAANLSAVRFVKVQTAVLRYAGIFGEVSTEIRSADGLSGDQSNGFPAP